MPLSADELAILSRDIKSWGAELGFQKVGIANVDLARDETRLDAWLAAQRHGSMEYMSRHGTKRSRPAELVPGTCRVISARMDYWPEDGSATRTADLGAARDAPGDPAAAQDAPADFGAARGVLADPGRGYVSRYALGRDYHKALRTRLARLARRVAQAAGTRGYRAFTDSAPVLEKALARDAGLGWIGKHTNLLDRHDGSWFFLGEIFTDLPLPVDAAVTSHCGSCTACIDVCPTRAIVAPYELDARRCISYLTIELHGSIPEEFRTAIGNRVYGCDDCQLVCPWNRYAKLTREQDFLPRHELDRGSLCEFFAWTAGDFEERTAGSAIARLGHERWLRNVAVALGNAPRSDDVIAALESRRDDPSALVREHVAWALERHAAAAGSDPAD
jgi:epoxyqueuosine reductase